MPELPEVETVVRGLRADLVGCTIGEVVVEWPGSITAPHPELFVQRLRGQRVQAIARRGKWVVITLDGGRTLLVHLRMTGQLLLDKGPCIKDKYTRVVFYLDRDRVSGSEDTGRECLRFADMRKFGRLILTKDPGRVLEDLGPEPLDEDFTAQQLGRMLAERRGRIKSLLLNQRFLVGLGNIYVNEALWQAGIHPLRTANSLSTEEVAKLHRSIRSVLRAAIAEGGTTLENGNFRQANGEVGEFAGQLLAYGREGEPCECCGVSIERIKVGQRSTFFCPRCQPLSVCD
jgi:formamidopyrimidine-DNA glycosylase